MTTRAEVVEDMLSSSEEVRDKLMAAVGRLDSYIDLLRTELVQRDTGTPGAGHEPTNAP